MTSLPFMQVNAFTDRRFAGNPCAVVFDADALDEATMQAVAREMNLSETAFVLRSTVADFGARYFTPAEEIPLAGHPTIATVHALAETGRLTLTSEMTVLTLELRVGPVEVEIHAPGGQMERIVMVQKKPRFLRVYEPEEVLPAFSLPPDAARPNVPIQTVSTGTPQLMIPLRNHAFLRHARFNVATYNALRARSDFFSPHLFSLGGISPDAMTFARHFGTPPDTLEDPFTGSATGGMAAYLWRYGLIEFPRFVAEQGHWMGRPGRASVEVVGPPDDVETVRVGGAAVTTMRGELLI